MYSDGFRVSTRHGIVMLLLKEEREEGRPEVLLEMHGPAE